MIWDACLEKTVQAEEKGHRNDGSAQKIGHPGVLLERKTHDIVASCVIDGARS
jgi:hypothetical protein